MFWLELQYPVTYIHAIIAGAPADVGQTASGPNRSDIRGQLLSEIELLKSATYISESERSNLLSLEQIIRSSNIDDLQMQGHQHLEILRNMR